MYKSDLRRLEPGSLEYVMAHARRQRGRGRGAAVPFWGVRNPRLAMATARRISDANAKLQRMDGYEQFHSNLPFATELDTDQASQEVVLAATRGDRSAQGESLWNFLDTIIAGYNLERPKEYIGVIHVWDFWPQFWNCENFMVNPQRRRPALVIASGYLRGHDGAGNCTFEVWDRLQAICDAHSVPLEHL